MTETAVSASHFRVHFKEIANSVARGGQRFTVARHGLEMVAVVSLEDLEFLRKHKRGAEPVERAETKSEPDMITLDHPDRMPIELVEEAYALSAGSTDRAVINWRGRAFLSIKARTGKYPKDGPGPPSG
ncbi:MAG TPA: type II toxin-antitoxin system prevent-host-death family antitoxin [Myxococcales bacterium]